MTESHASLSPSPPNAQVYVVKFYFALVSLDAETVVSICRDASVDRRPEGEVRTTGNLHLTLDSHHQNNSVSSQA